MGVRRNCRIQQFIIFSFSLLLLLSTYDSRAWTRELAPVRTTSSQFIEFPLEESVQIGRLAQQVFGTASAYQSQLRNPFFKSGYQERFISLLSTVYGSRHSGAVPYSDVASYECTDCFGTGMSVGWIIAIIVGVTLVAAMALSVALCKADPSTCL